MQAAAGRRAPRGPRAPDRGANPAGKSTPAGAAPSLAPRHNARPAVLWSALGFLSGALFWHAVGFWGFMSEIVLDRPQGSRIALPAVQAGPVTGSLPTILRVDPAHCTALALKRATNETVVRPCPARGLALRLEADGRREDLAVALEPSITAARYRPN